MRPLGLQKDQDTAFTCASSLAVFPLPNWLPSLTRLMRSLKLSQTLGEAYSMAMAERWVAANRVDPTVGSILSHTITIGERLCTSLSNFVSNQLHNTAFSERMRWMCLNTLFTLTLGKVHQSLFLMEITPRMSSMSSTQLEVAYV